MEDEMADVLVPVEALAATNGVHAEETAKLRSGAVEPTRNGAAETRSAENPTLFWGTPVSGQEDLSWFVPPLPDREARDSQLSGMLDQFGTMLQPQQPRRAWLLQWNYRTRAAAAAAELTDIERESQAQLSRQQEQAERDLKRLDEKIKFLHDSSEQIETDLIEAKKDFAESAARAGLNGGAPAEIEAPRVRRRREQAHVAEPAVSLISPRHVEEALEAARPTLLEMAGEHGIGPIGHSSFLSTLLQFFMQFLAPLVAGLMLALCLGTLVGLVDIDTLQRADGAPKLALCAALGFVIVYLMGEVYHGAVGALARGLEARQQWDGGSHLPVPRLRADLGIAIALAIVALILGFAEITAEAMGIRQLHGQEVARQQRFHSTTLPGSASEMPLVVYMLIGTLISGPYLVYKSAHGWSENEGHLREAWLTHRQRIWLEERRADADVQQTFHQAYIVEHLENSLRGIKAQLLEAEAERDRAMHIELNPQAQARRQSARAAAVGEAARMQQSLEDLVEATEPMPQRAADRRVVTPGPPPRGNATWNRR